jgi:drug/metabolite transporter (DMT)-like permease
MSSLGLYPIASLVGESLLAMYPVLIQLMDLHIETHTWIRLASYCIISALFANYTVLGNVGFAKLMTLSVINIIHITSSYYGFRYLLPSLAETMFYTYPFINLLLNVWILQENIVWTKFIFIVPILGAIYLLYTDQEHRGEIEMITPSNSSGKQLPPKFEPDVRIGIPAIIISALTESILYILIRTTDLGTGLWNGLLATYGFAAIIYSVYYGVYHRDTLSEEWKTKRSQLLKVIFINLCIGSVGYGLRFMSMPHVPPVLFSTISYSGIFFAVAYSVWLSIEKMSPRKWAGLGLLGGSLVGFLFI